MTCFFYVILIIKKKILPPKNGVSCSLCTVVFSGASFVCLQALKALQDMSIPTPSVPPLLSIRHSKAIPVQAFEVGFTSRRTLL